MRTSRIGSLAAVSALASATILAGAGAANASLDPGSLFPGSEDQPEVVDTATLSPDNPNASYDGTLYTMTATAFDNCTVDFTLVSNWDHETQGEEYGNWRGDYRVGEEDAVLTPGINEGVGNRGTVYRPVVGSNEAIADAIANRGNPYDFAARSATVDLTEPRIVPSDEDNSQTVTLPGVEPNADGTHEVTFGVYQGPTAQRTFDYADMGSVTVQGCPIAEDDDLLGSIVGSVDVFGSLEDMS